MFVPYRKAHIFSFELTRLIWTTDTFLCPESQTLIYRQPHFTDTGYLCTAIFICALIVNIVSCSSNEIFLRVSTILLESQRQAANVNLYHVNKFPIFLSFTVHVFICSFLIMKLCQLESHICQKRNA